jgi:hypothetical protein
MWLYCQELRTGGMKRDEFQWCVQLLSLILDCTHTPGEANGEREIYTKVI